MKRKLKFPIAYPTGLVEAGKDIRPLVAKFNKQPAWLKKYKFFTHKTPLGNFGLTEQSTGFSVIRGLQTRAAAKSEGFHRIISAGCEKFRSAVATAKLRFK